MVAFVLLIEAAIPIGDMVIVLTAGGSAKRALGLHGMTAAVMVLTAVLLLVAVR